MPVQQFKKGDRVVVTSPVYSANGSTWEHSGLVHLGDTGTVTHPAPDADGDVYIRLDWSDILAPVYAEGLAPYTEDEDEYDADILRRLDSLSLALEALAEVKETYSVDMYDVIAVATYLDAGGAP